MPAWFLGQYKASPVKPQQRYCVIEDYAAQINADGGRYAYRECLGNNAVVAVRGATAATLTAIAADPLTSAMPQTVSALTDLLSLLTDPQWTNLRTKVLSLGYPAAEFDAAFPLTRDNYTLRDLLQFMLRRRLTPRWDIPSQTVILNGPIAATGTPDDVVTQIG